MADLPSPLPPASHAGCAARKCGISVLAHGLNLIPETAMTAPLKAIDGNADLPALMTELAANARAAARVLGLALPDQKNRALDAIARAIRTNAPAILAANAEDLGEVRASGA